MALFVVELTFIFTSAILLMALCHLGMLYSDLKNKVKDLEAKTLEALIAAEGLKKSTVLQKVIEKVHFIEQDQNETEKLAKINETMNDEIFGANAFYPTRNKTIRPEDTV